MPASFAAALLLASLATPLSSATPSVIKSVIPGATPSSTPTSLLAPSPSVAPGDLAVSLGGDTLRFPLFELESFAGTVVEVHGPKGVERTTVAALGLHVLRGHAGTCTLSLISGPTGLRGEVVDHRDGSLHILSGLDARALRSGRAVLAEPASPQLVCGVSDDPSHEHHAHEAPLAPVPEGGVAGASCRRECVFLIDTDYLHFVNSGGTVADATAAVLLAIDTVDAVYEKHVGTSFATSVVVVRTDQATDPYAGLTAAGSLLDLARVIWTDTTEYERDLVHLFSGTDGSDGIGGVAWVGVVCNSYGVGMSRFSSSNVFCHEVGHNFGAPHCADEPCDTMCGGCLWMGPNDKIIMTNHRDGATCLAEDPSPEGPVPPDAQLDEFTVAGGSAGNLLDVRANDTDYSCEETVIGAVSASEAGAAVSVVGTPGAQSILYEPPAGFVGIDRFTYTLVDGDALEDEAEVRVAVTTPGTIEVGRGCGASTQSLQVAVDLADPTAGAEILVGPGRYGAVDFGGKPIRLRSTDGPLATFISADGLRGVTVVGAGADGAVVEGFTIHGTSADNGGGILIDGADTVVRNCRFVGTSALSTTSGGGGLRVRLATTRVEDCAFLGCSGANGGGIRTENASIEIVRCDFDGCAATSGNGGGIHASGLGSYKVVDCTARGCSATGNGGFARFESGASGQVGGTTVCGGSPNNLSGSYTSLGGNSSTATCDACGALPWRNAVDCDGDGAPDHCTISDDAARDLDGDGLLDACASEADLLIAVWSADCGGSGAAYEAVFADPPVNWSTASSRAISRGGRLASINTEAEADFVYGRLASISSLWEGAQGPWIGLIRSGGAWKWSSGEALVFDQWAPGEPNGSGDRGRYWNPAGVSPTWDDQPGSNTAISFIVEYPDAVDCNGNGLPDARDLALGISSDDDGDGIPDECAPPACAADLFEDGAVDAADLAALLDGWGTASGDVNGDGTTDATDLAALLDAWGPC